jgi:hypothetical protein
MTLTGLAYDPTVPDDAVLTIEGPDYYASGWAAALDPIPAPGHKPGCMWADYGIPAPVCTCQPPL